MVNLFSWLKSSVVVESLEDKERLEITPGDGKAVFFSDGTEEEYEEWLDEQKGWKEWLKTKLI